MKIAQVIASIESRHGGPSRSSVGLSKGLAEAGNNVELLTTAETPHQEQQGLLTTHAFSRGNPKRFSVSSELNGYLRKNDFEVLHHHGLWLRTLHYVHQRAKSSSVPFVISPRGMMSHWSWNHHRSRKRFANAVIHPGAIKATTGWHATSQGEADEIRALGFDQPICIAPNGVQLPEPEQTQIAREFWLNRVPLIKNRKVALFYSRLHRKKRVMELIEMWPKIAPDDWLLLVVGIPDQYSVRQLAQKAASHGGGENIRVFNGTAVPPPYAAANILLLPSHSENFGLVIAEALATGVPVITTDETPWEELNSRDAGWCVNYEEFRKVLKIALNEPLSNLKSRGAIGHQWVKQKFTWEVVAASMAAFYKRLQSEL